MKTLIAFYETVSHAKQAVSLLAEDAGIERERVQIATQGTAAKAEEYFDDVPGVVVESESEALGAGGGAMVAVRVAEEEEDAAVAVLRQFGLVELASYDGEVDLEAEAEPTWVDYEAAYQRHYEANYAPKGQLYAMYAPAYRFGYTLAVEGDEAEWGAVADTARHRWEAEELGDWEQFAPAVRFAWEEVAAGPETMAEALGDGPIQTTKRGRLYQELHEED